MAAVCISLIASRRTENWVALDWLICLQDEQLAAWGWKRSGLGQLFPLQVTVCKEGAAGFQNLRYAVRISEDATPHSGRSSR